MMTGKLANFSSNTGAVLHVRPAFLTTYSFLNLESLLQQLPVMGAREEDGSGRPFLGCKYRRRAISQTDRTTRVKSVDRNSFNVHFEKI